MDLALTLINPEDIEFDKKNPRGESKKKIESDPAFDRLYGSIKDYTILVPLVVRKNEKGKKQYILVDGERRLRAALKKKEKLVPAHIVEKGEEDARVLSYQIHMLRKQWSKSIQVRALKELRDNLIKKNRELNERQINKILRKITTLRSYELKEQLTLLKYDSKTVKEVQEGKLAYSYLIQIEDNFISLIKREFPKLHDSYTKSELRKILVNKAKNLKLGHTRYLADYFRELFKNIKKKNKLRNSIKKFLDNPEEDICDVVKKFKKKKEKSKKVSKKKKKTRKKKETKVPEPVDHKASLLDFEKEIIENNIFDLIFNNMREAIKEFEKRADIQFKDEPELQNFIYAILRSLFVSVEFEDPTEKICGKSNRLDFVLKDHKIIIEVKYVRDRGHAKKVSEELSADYLRYKQSPYGNKIINYIYDPEKHIDNQALFRKELKKTIKDANHYIE